MSITGSLEVGRVPAAHCASEAAAPSWRTHDTLRVRVVSPHAEGVLQVPVAHWNVQAEKSSYGLLSSS